VFGARINVVLLGEQSKRRFGLGPYFALGIGTGMLLFAQAVLSDRERNSNGLQPGTVTQTAQVARLISDTRHDSSPRSRRVKR
jgi:hypothetical protein